MADGDRRSRSAGGAGLSLKGRALRLLAQREHSRVEMTRKLATHAESPEQLERVLGELEQRGFLSQQRFAESLAHRRGARFGLRRIEQELGAHRLDPDTTRSVLAPLRDSERARALSAWRKRFGEAATQPAERARQQRFLMQRGFTADAVGWVLRHAGAPQDDGVDRSSDD
jgi:regulatory protein